MYVFVLHHAAPLATYSSGADVRSCPHRASVSRAARSCIALGMYVGTPRPGVAIWTRSINSYVVDHIPSMLWSGRALAQACPFLQA